MSNYRDDVREMLKKFKSNSPSPESTPAEKSSGIEPKVSSKLRSNVFLENNLHKSEKL